MLLLQRENLADPDNYTLAATGRLQLSDSTVLRATLQVRARKAGKRMQVNLCAHIPDSIYLVGVSVGHLCASRCKFINAFCTSASPTVQPHSTLAGALIKDMYFSPRPMPSSWMLKSCSKTLSVSSCMCYCLVLAAASGRQPISPAATAATAETLAAIVGLG